MIEYGDYTKETFERYDFIGGFSVRDYLTSKKDTLAKIPRESGIYLVLYPYKKVAGMFLPIGTGGRFKGKNPNVSIEDLNEKWVENTDILYIGKAGGINKQGRVLKSTLKQRVGSLLSFGNNKRAAHWGGRYLWQHSNAKDFKIYWYVCKDNENAVDLEKVLFAEFERVHGKLPYANISR